MKTGQELFEQAKTKYPEKKFALDVKEEVLGEWNTALNRYVTIACKTIGVGQWVTMPYEILINGELPIIEWKE